MPQAQIADLWKVTSGIREDVGEIKIAIARMEERSTMRDGQVDVQSARLDRLETKLQRLDMKVAAAMGAVMLISYGLQLMVNT
mgnify:FL=1